MGTVIIDVREPAEYARGHVGSAVNIPLNELANRSNKLDNISKNTKLVVYCQSGNRSNLALKILNSLGYTNLVNGINQATVETNYLF